MKHSIKAAGVFLLLSVSLVGCSEVEEIRGQAEQVITEAKDLGELTRENVENFDWTSLSEYEGILLGDNSKVTEFFRSMPSGPDMESFQIKGEEGKLVVNYGDQATKVDPAVLQKTMEDVAAQAKEHVQNLETVEFRVGEQAYTF